MGHLFDRSRVHSGDLRPEHRRRGNLEAKLLYGRSLWPVIPGYTNLEIGYRWRDQEPSDEIRYLVEFGIDVSEQFYTRAKLDGIFSVDNGEHRDDSGNPTTTNNFDIGKLDLTVRLQDRPGLGGRLRYRNSSGSRDLAGLDRFLSLMPGALATSILACAINCWRTS